MCGIIGPVQFVGKLLYKEALHRRFFYFTLRVPTPIAIIIYHPYEQINSKMCPKILYLCPRDDIIIL